MSDLISREDAIGIIRRASAEKKNNYHGFTEKGLIEYINALPSADTRPTCNTCADKALCIMSAPDGQWKACKDYRPSAEPSADRPQDAPEPAPVVAYICDRRRCAICSGPDGGCDHTTDIKHAAHFKNVAGQYFEKPYMEEDNG